MQVNYRKSKLMVSNPGRSRDFYLTMFIVNSLELEVVEEINLLGDDDKK